MVKRDKPATKGNGKIKQPEVTRVELRADGDFHMSEKPGWSAVDIGKQPKNEKASMRKNKNNQHHKNLLNILLKVESQEIHQVKGY